MWACVNRMSSFYLIKSLYDVIYGRTTDVIASLAYFAVTWQFRLTHYISAEKKGTRQKPRRDQKKVVNLLKDWWRNGKSVGNRD